MDIQHTQIVVGIDFGTKFIKYSTKQGYGFINKTIPNVVSIVDDVYLVGKKAEEQINNHKSVVFVPSTLKEKTLCYFLFFNIIQQETKATYAVLTFSPLTPLNEVNILWYLAQSIFGSATLVSMIASQALMFNENIKLKKDPNTNNKTYEFLDFGATTLQRSKFIIDGLNINIEETVPIDISNEQKIFDEKILEMNITLLRKFKKLKIQWLKKQLLFEFSFESGQKTYKISIKNQDFDELFKSVFEKSFEKVIVTNLGKKGQMYCYGEISNLNCCKELIQDKNFELIPVEEDGHYHASNGCCMIGSLSPNFIDKQSRLSNMKFNATIKPNTFTIECYKNTGKTSYFEKMHKYGESPLSKKEFISSTNFPNKPVETQNGMLEVTGEFEGFIVLKQGNDVVAWTQEPIEKVNGLYIELIKTLQIWQLPNQLFCTKTPKQFLYGHEKDPHELLKRPSSLLLDFIIPFTNTRDGQEIHGEYPLLFKALADPDPVCEEILIKGFEQLSKASKMKI
ncbi:hypothetical protein QTN25_006319 [Entamoeba marina]